MNQKKSVWIKIIIGIAVIVFCFVPLIHMSYDVVVQRLVREEYTTVEPYTVLEEVKELVGGRYYSSLEVRNEWVPQYEIVIKEVTKYREVTKTRWVERPVVETHTKQVSILRYLLG